MDLTKLEISREHILRLIQRYDEGRGRRSENTPKLLRTALAAHDFADAFNAADRIPYDPQGPEVSAIADAIHDQSRNGGGFHDAGTFMEAARDALNRLSRAGFIAVPIPSLAAPGDVGKGG